VKDEPIQQTHIKIWMPHQCVEEEAMNNGLHGHHTICATLSTISATYDHRLWRIGHPVRSAVHKPQIGRSVVGSVTTSESLLLYVLLFSLIVLGNVGAVSPRCGLVGRLKDPYGGGCKAAISSFRNS
jgi:hypothetical protein